MKICISLFSRIEAIPVLDFLHSFVPVSPCESTQYSWRIIWNEWDKIDFFLFLCILSLRNVCQKIFKMSAIIDVIIAKAWQFQNCSSREARSCTKINLKRGRKKKLEAQNNLFKTKCWIKHSEMWKRGLICSHFSFMWWQQSSIIRGCRSMRSRDKWFIWNTADLGGGNGATNRI